ncbi:MAG: hypothetical protein WEC59_08160 [Salibacteraceae bacterium]
MRLSLIFILLFYAVLSHAQSGKVMFQVQPRDALIKVNDQSYSNEEWHTFEAGNYTARSWRSEYDLVEHSFEVKGNDSTIVVFNLPQGEDFLTYKRDLLKYNAGVGALRYVSTGAYGAFILLSLNRLNTLSAEVDALRSDALVQQELYYNSVFIDDINQAEQEYNELKSKHDAQLQAHNNLQSQTVLLGTIFGALVVACNVLSFQLDKPTFSEHIQLSYVPSSTANNGLFAARLNIPIR